MPHGKYLNYGTDICQFWSLSETSFQEGNSGKTRKPFCSTRLNDFVLRYPENNAIYVRYL